MKKVLKTLAVVGAMGFASTAAHAVPVQVLCPGTAAMNDREFSITTDPGTATCLAFGPGNLNGDSNDAFRQAFPSYELIDKSDDNTSGTSTTALDGSTSDLVTGLSGDFSFLASLWNTYSSIAIGFKTGNGQLDPDWVVFGLPSGVFSGTWSISGQQELSHVNLYGIPGTTSPVPLPAAGWMLLAALGGIAALRRRMKA